MSSRIGLLLLLIVQHLVNELLTPHLASTSPPAWRRRRRGLCRQLAEQLADGLVEHSRTGLDLVGEQPGLADLELPPPTLRHAQRARHVRAGQVLELPIEHDSLNDRELHGPD